MQKCEKHGCQLHCMAGRNAHPSNWYCPECDAEEEVKETKLTAAENTIKNKIKDFNLFCADIMNITLDVDTLSKNGKAYNPWENYEELAAVVEQLMDEDEDSDYDMMLHVNIAGFLQTWREYVLLAMEHCVDNDDDEKNFEMLMAIRDELTMNMNDLLTDEDLENIIEVAKLYYKDCVDTLKKEDVWTPIVKGNEPEGKVLVSYQEPFFGKYTTETEPAYFEDGIWRFWLSDKKISTLEDGVTHWMPLPERKNEKN